MVLLRRRCAAHVAAAAAAVALLAIGAWAGVMAHESSEAAAAAAAAEPLKVDVDPLTPEVPNQSKPPQQAPELHTMGERLSAFGDTLNTLRMPAWGWPIKLTGEAISAYQDSVDRAAAAQTPPGPYDYTMGLVRTSAETGFDPNNPNRGNLYGPNTTPVISKPPAAPWDPQPPTGNGDTHAPLKPGDPNGDIRPLDTSPSAEQQARLNRQAMDAAEAASQGAKQALNDDDVKQSAAAAGGKAGDTAAAAAAADAAKPKPDAAADGFAADKADAQPAGGDEELSTPASTIRDRVARALDNGDADRGGGGRRAGDRDTGRRGGGGARRGDRNGDRRGGGRRGDGRGDRRGGGRGGGRGGDGRGDRGGR